MKIPSFLKEIWRRRVLQVAIPYGIGAWLMVQVAEIILDAFEAPPWIMQGLLVVLVLGYPVAVVLAWIFDITPNHKIVRTAPLGSADEEPEEEPIPAPALSLEMGESQRRQVTMLSCVFEFNHGEDPEADPENLRSTIAALKVLTQGLTERYGAHPLPGGAEELTLVFGYPLAREDDARRAVTAGLALIAEIDGMNRSDPGLEASHFSTRIGVSTGLVVVDESLSEEHGVTIIGQTPRLANWLRALAEPGTIIIGPNTQKLIANHFELELLGKHHQTQFGGAIAVYRASTAVSTDRSLARNVVLTGRKDEMRLLRDRWENVLDGGGQFVVLQGEPGIGKSSVLDSFVQSVLEGGDASLVPCQCSPYELHNPLTPVIRVFQESVLKFTDEDNAESRSRKLLSYLEHQSVDLDEAVPLMASLLSLDMGPEYPPPSQTSQIVRVQTMELLLDMISLAAVRKPLLLLMEDLHWADPSTLEMIQMMVDRGPAPGLFVLFSTRPGFQADWTRRSYVLVQELQPLSRKDARQLVIGIEGAAELPDALVDRIIEETDGNPLFIQELTLAVLESDAWRKSQASGGRQDMTWLKIPATLQESLAARIDNLGDAKSLLQLCSVLGREFSYELLKTVSGTENEVALKQELTEIVGSEMLFQRGVLKNLTYSFRHILIQESAYNSLLKSKRRELHGRTAEILEEEMAQAGQNEPALLAFHFSEAGNLDKAIPYWTLASRHSLSSFALKEATEQSKRGIELLETLSESPKRASQEVPLQSIRGTALLSAHGYADPRVRKVFTRAQDLCEQIGDTPQLFQVAVGLWMYYIITAQLEEAYEQSQRLLRIAETTADPGQNLQAHYSQAFTLYYQADFKAAKSHLETAMANEVPGCNYAAQSASGDDTRVHVRVMLALVEWHLGSPKTASRMSREACALAKELKHPYGMVFAAFFSAWLQQMKGDAKQTLAYATEAVRIAEEKGFRFFMVLAGFMSIWAGIRDAGKKSIPLDAAAVEKMKAMLEAYRGSGAGMGVTYLSFKLAEDYLWLKEYDSATRELEHGWAALLATGERFFESEYYRLQGKLCLAEYQDSGEEEQLDAAHKLFTTALSTARERTSLALQLRCGNDLAEVLSMQGKPTEAVELLDGIIEQFHEKDSSQDFIRAEKILKKLKKIMKQTA